LQLFEPGRLAHREQRAQFESELQNGSQEAAPSSPSLSPTVSEKLERYGSSALSGVEHLSLIIGKEDLAQALVRHDRLVSDQDQ
jgi:hypothetical protein